MSKAPTIEERVAHAKEKLLNPQGVRADSVRIQNLTEGQVVEAAQLLRLPSPNYKASVETYLTEEGNAKYDLIIFRNE